MLKTPAKKERRELLYALLLRECDGDRDRFMEARKAYMVSSSQSRTTVDKKIVLAKKRLGIKVERRPRR